MLTKRHVGSGNEIDSKVSPSVGTKYAWIFVHRHYVFREANCSHIAKLKENCELQGTDILYQDKYLTLNVKWRLLCLLSFKYWGISVPLVDTFRSIA